MVRGPLEPNGSLETRNMREELIEAIRRGVCVPTSLGFEDPQFPDKVYKVKQKDDGIFISQDKYVADILKKFDFVTVKRFQVTHKVSHLHAVKRIFRYLKDQPKLGLWYPRDSPFDLNPFFYGISDEFGVKTGSCKVNAARQDLVLLDKKGNADFHQIVDFLNASTIRYSLTISPTIYASYIEQFWATAKSKIVNNETQIHAKVDGKTIVISESSVRSNLHFNDEDGVTSLTNSKILENLALMGYEIVSDKLTFQKAFFSPQWKYLIHTILHCLSLKSTAWNEFSTNIASAVISLANNQKFNFSKLIFDGMLRNLNPTSKKFLMYPRFLQLFLNNQVKNLAEPFNDTYETPKHTQKVFANMRRKGKGFLGTVTPLFASMLVPQVVEGEGSGQPSEPQPPPSTVLSSQEGQVFVVAPSHPQKTQTPRQAKRGQDTEIPQSGGPLEKVGDEAIYKKLGDRVERATTTAASLDTEQDSGGNTPGSVEERLEQHELTDNVPPTPHDLPLPGGHTPGSDEGRLKQDKLMDIVTALSQKVKGLKSDLKKTKKLYDTAFKKLINRVKSLDDELKGSFQTGEESDRRNGFGYWNFIEVSTAAQVSTASIFVSTATPQRNADTTADDLTLAETLMKIRKSVAKDKGKAKMGETESPRKMKQRERVSRDEEVAQKLQEDEEDLPMMLVELVNQRKKFFAQQRVKAKRNKPMTPAQQKDYMSNYIKNQEGGSGLEVQRLKRAGQEFLEKLVKRQKIGEASGSEAYQIFADMLKKFDRDDLVKLWDLVKERFSTTEPTDDKEKELWVELKRLFEPDNDDILWKLQRGTLGLMMVARLLVKEDSEMSRELLRKIFYQANRPRQGGLLGIKGFYSLMLLVQVCAAAED
ncbi:hypothetical protein Tco_1055151 [Tanacetum coccineum]|uniref:Reverse transcriptase Ty1/copia-type domain-containing protein n=1 Tax=Tanacetum coccineum TaxID=301880 RepID=A0ABQ5GZT1_9ASTR